jgi:hypothetical protein
MSIISPTFNLPCDFLPPEAALWWLSNSELFLRLLKAGKNGKRPFTGDLSHNLLIYPPNYHIMENEMNGRKSTEPKPRLVKRDGVALPFQWVNITLTPEDVGILESEKASLEQLALAFISVGMLGFGLSCKYDFARKSFVCCIYRPYDGNDVQPCGVSGSATDLRDALLVLLYKFNNRMGGGFDNATLENNPVQSKRFK